MIPSLYVLAALVCGYVTFQFIGTQKKSTESTLSSPPRQPLVGHLFQVPLKHPWVRFAQWKHVYGDVIPLKIFSRNLLILNTREAAVELFEKRSAIYSERPKRQMASLCGFEKSLLFARYGDSTRQNRKLLYAEISQKASERYLPVQEHEVQCFLTRVASSSHVAVDLLGNAQRLSSGVILRISHGYRVKGPDDRLVQLADEVMGFVDRVITPNKYLVDSLPFLRFLPEWFPGCSFQKEAKRCQNLIAALMHEPFQMAKSDVMNGVAPPSLVSRRIEGRLHELSEQEADLIMWTAGGLYAGGSHTTVAILMTFFLCMLLFPDVQRKAQEELDRVIGPEKRLPKFIDRKYLPYIECVLQEVLRWRPVTPLAAHSNSADDVVQGQFIPKGTVVMANLWAYTRNEAFPDPERFDPERFRDPDVPDPRTLVFGFGRRSCPGIYLVDNLLWIAIATTLFTMDILPVTDDVGNPILPKPEWSSGAVSHPPQFDCQFKPRRGAEELLEQALSNSSFTSEEKEAPISVENP